LVNERSLTVRGDLWESLLGRFEGMWERTDRRMDRRMDAQMQMVEMSESVKNRAQWVSCVRMPWFLL
jgi:hypothetical protein